MSIQPSLNAESLKYEAGTVPSARTVNLPLRGRVQNYPFDHYKGSYSVQAYTVGEPSGGTLPSAASGTAEGRRLAVSVAASFRDPGWRLDTRATSSDTFQTSFDQEISRAGSTVAISILLLTLMLFLGLIAAWVAQSVVAGFIDAQVSVAAWMAALHFALIPIRSFLPGSPPVGSWIDILVFFWVEVAVMIAMVVVVLTVQLRARRAAAAMGPSATDR